jgi:AraC-like DNA-binding protein
MIFPCCVAIGLWLLVRPAAWEKLQMAQTAHVLASGPGWQAADVLCTDGPHDRHFEERHDGFCIAFVQAGVFRYRGTEGEALLAPGCILTGNHGQCFECGHDHSRGDRCFSFNLRPEFLETIVADIPGARRIGFTGAKLPPSARLIPLASAAQAAGDDAGALEEIAVRFAGYAMACRNDGERRLRMSARDERIVADALHHIEENATLMDERSLSLAALAQSSKLGPYRFLRLFHRLVGMTPHQYVLHCRLSRAAAHLLTGDEDISVIAYESGFGDLSTFNRRFRTLLGVPPGHFRAGQKNGGPKRPAKFRERLETT